MLFNSLLFVLLFLPLAWSGFRICAWIGLRPSVGWLAGASLLFYGWWNPAYLFLLCGSILFNYGMGLAMQACEKRPALGQGVLIAGISANIALLCYYKYLFPLLHWMERFGFHPVAPDAGVILPLGISFFTFTQIGYLVDCKAGIAAGGRFLDYVLFVTFFPHLIAGPILHHREMMPQFKDRGLLRFRLDNIAVGLSIFFVGMAKKVLVADYFASFANLGFGSPESLTFVGAWSAALSFSIQLYFDFSGYSEMAMGLALLFNIRFPANFDSPYKSPSIIEFWQRWHMTLTRYLNLYLYNPVALWVARSRVKKNLPVGRQGLKSVPGFLALVVFPTTFTMALAGVWHGAGINFVIFGLLHAFYLCVNHAWRLLHKHRKNAPAPSGLMRYLDSLWKVGLTYSGVLLAEVFFRADSFSGALHLLATMAHAHSPMGDVVEVRTAKPLLLAFAFVWLAPNVLQIFAGYEPTLSKPHASAPGWMQWKPTMPWAIGLGLVAVIAFLAITGQTEFLYFRF